MVKHPARKLFLEGGGNKNTSLQTECRRAFTMLLEAAGFNGRLPAIIPCGGRRQAYDQFCTAVQGLQEDDVAVLLVDSEVAVTESSPWAHVKQREGDGWEKPDDASGDQLHLMVQCMETWFLADRIDTDMAARICQRTEHDGREILEGMERKLGYLERGGTGRGTYWTLRPDVHRRLAAPGHPDRDRRLDWEAAKTRVLSVLKRRAEQNEEGLSNADLRQITYLDRGQVKRLMAELRREGLAISSGRGRGTRWHQAGGAE